MEGIKGLSPDKRRKSLIIDDVPVPSPQKDFSVLLEEHLQGAVGINEPQTQKTTAKFPFLKKGQGLARYKPKSDNSHAQPRSRSNTLPSNTKFNTQKSAQKPKEPVYPLRRSQSTKRLIKTVTPKPCTNITNNKNKNISIQSKNLGIVPAQPIQLQKTNDQLNVSSDLNSSDPEIKTRKELEEIRIFELMEEKAENSSFCSNSSAVVAFLQQSSPLRNQLFMQRMSSQTCHTSGKQKEEQKQQIQEVVCSTSSVTVVQTKSPLRQTYQRRPMINDEGTAKWENFDTQRKNIEEKEPALSSSQEKVVCTVPYGTEELSDDEYSKDIDNPNESLNESFASLHVRFAEVNEYRTASDISSICMDKFDDSSTSSNNKISCDDSITSDFSDTESKMEMLFRNNELNGSMIRKNLVKQFFEQKNDSPENDVDSYDDESISAKVTEEEDNDDDDDDEETDAEYSSNTSQDDTLLESNEDRFKNQINNEDENDEEILFKSSKLKSRLLQLDHEIEDFRNATEALKIQRQKLEEERKALKGLEDMARAEKLRVENYLLEEKKRLAREKAALDSRLKDAREKAQKNKQERDEIANLKHQLDELREELHQKESKWQAAQARHKSQVRVLMTQNKQLKEELERLEKLKLERQKSRKPNTAAKNNTRVIHQINRMLQSANYHRNKSGSSEDEGVENCEPYVETETKLQPPSEQEISPIDIERQRNLYKDLIKDASIGILEYDEINRNAEVQCRNVMKESLNKSYNSNLDDIKEKEKLAETRFALNLSQNADMSAKLQKSMFKMVKEIKRNGYIEQWFSNGSVLKIFPEKNLKKTIYYNGDVKESDATGKIRYFYASSRTWHTTMPNGLEILEYSDGKIEKRNTDGTIEITYPDGTIKIWEASELKKWILPDGTEGITLADGTIIFSMLNGQKEVHTKDFKKREYPNGTVKTVHVDGTSETRYYNGRVRIKDKDGNVVMDSHPNII